MSGKFLPCSGQLLSKNRPPMENLCNASLFLLDQCRYRWRSDVITFRLLFVPWPLFRLNRATCTEHGQLAAQILANCIKCHWSVGNGTSRVNVFIVAANQRFRIHGRVESELVAWISRKDRSYLLPESWNSLWAAQSHSRMNESNSNL